MSEVVGVGVLNFGVELIITSEESWGSTTIPVWSRHTGVARLPRFSKELARDPEGVELENPPRLSWVLTGQKQMKGGGRESRTIRKVVRRCTQTVARIGQGLNDSPFPIIHRKGGEEGEEGEAER